MNTLTSKMIPTLKFVTGLLAMALALFPLIANSAEPVAMITDLKGNVYLANKPKTAPLAVLSYLPPGEEIVLEAGAQIVVTYFAQSTEYSFKGPGRVVIHAQEAKALKGSAETRRLDTEKSGAAMKFVQSGKLTFATVEMRALSFVKPTLLSPVNTKIASLTPVFKWKGLDDTEKYLMTLMDERGQIVRQVEVMANSWTMPANAILQHGANYRWRVDALFKTGDKLNAEGSFSVADIQTINRIIAQQPPANASFSDNVTYAIFLEEEGFRESAKGIWQELSAQRPDDPNLKRRAR
ncbi:MAG: hypothetical protein Q7J38_06645 [Gallionella sp.]|nr:hypothetical protein [Gallionella sp.]